MRLIKDLDIDIAGRDVVLVEDIVDTGLTLAYLLGRAAGAGRPASLEVCTLFDKRARRIVPCPCATSASRSPTCSSSATASTSPGRYRNLDLVAAGRPRRPAPADPDAYVGGGSYPLG